MIFLSQINSKIHCSPDLDNVQVIIKFIVQISESFLKVDHFRFIYGAVFIDNLCLYSYLSQKFIACPCFTCIYDCVCILATRYCKPFMTSENTLSGKSNFFFLNCRQDGNQKKETFWGIINICIFYLRPWVN